MCPTNRDTSASIIFSIPRIEAIQNIQVIQAIQNIQNIQVIQNLPAVPSCPSLQKIFASRKPFKVPVFSHPKKPVSDDCEKGHLVLCNACDSSNSFLRMFDNIRKERSAKGTSKDEEQDLLRAMFIFASSGMDSLVKQLVKDTLLLVINSNEGAEERFKTFIERQLQSKEEINRKLLANVIGDKEPRSHMIKLLIQNLTSSSLQSTGELFRVAFFFNISTENIIKDRKQLSKIFQVRNQIVHEMDIDFSQSNRNRRPRKRQEMVDNTKEIFLVSENFLKGVDSLLPA